MLNAKTDFKYSCLVLYGVPIERIRLGVSGGSVLVTVTIELPQSENAQVVIDQMSRVSEGNMSTLPWNECLRR